VPVNGGQAKKITENPASDSVPRYSPDGKYIAYLAQARPGYESDRFRLVLYDRKTTQRTSLTENFDRWVGAFAFAPDSKSIYFVAGDKGEQPIYRIAVGERGAAPREITRATNDDLAIAPDGKTLYFTRMSVRAPNEIWTLAAGERQARALTRINEPVLSQLDLPAMESFWFTGAENAKVQGFLIKPPNFNPQQKYPVKFLIHGGPQGAWGDEWSYRWNPELLAANGYAVVMVNPRGSTGYGQRFIDDINGDCGGRAFVDLMRGLDYVEGKYGFVDKTASAHWARATAGTWSIGSWVTARASSAWCRTTACSTPSPPTDPPRNCGFLNGSSRERLGTTGPCTGSGLRICQRRRSKRRRWWCTASWTTASTCPKATSCSPHYSG